MSNRERNACLFALLLGSGILLLWTILLLSNKMVEFRTQPVQAGLHLMSEGILAGSLIASGYSGLARKPLARELFVFSTGMLTYSVLNASGYYLQRGEWLAPLVLLLAGAGGIWYCVRLRDQQ